LADRADRSDQLQALERGKVSFRPSRIKRGSSSNLTFTFRPNYRTPWRQSCRDPSTDTTRVASRRTGVRAKPVIPLRARIRLHRSARAFGFAKAGFPHALPRRVRLSLRKRSPGPKTSSRFCRGRLNLPIEPFRYRRGARRPSARQWGRLQHGLRRGRTGLARVGAR
jgi:hypothetical protein